MNTDADKKRVATSLFTGSMEEASSQSASKRQKISSTTHADVPVEDKPTPSNPIPSSYHSPPPSASSTASGSLHTAALQRSRRQPKSRQLFGDSPPSKAAAAAAASEEDADSRRPKQQKPASAAKMKRESAVEGGSLSALKKKRTADSLTDAAASYAASTNSALFSTLAHRKGHHAATSSAMQLSVPGKSSRNTSHRVSSSAHDTEDDADMEDAEEEMEEEEEEEEMEDEVDDEDDEAYDDVDERHSHASGDVRRGYHSSQRFPFSFAPLNHQPWMLSWMQHANPIGINATQSSASPASSVPSSTAPLSLSHALQNPAFVRSCYAQFAYSPLVSWSLKSGSFDEALAEQLGVPVSSLPDRMTKSEWNAARRMMGAPRRLSVNFLLRERQRLATAQHKAKEWQMRLVRATHESNVMKLKASIRNKNSLTPQRMRKPLESHSTIAASSDSSLYDPTIDIMLAPDDCPTLLQIGTRVLAPHPRGVELSPGVVLGSQLVLSRVHQDTDGDMSESENSSIGEEQERLVYRIKFLDLPTKVGASLIDSEDVRLIHSSKQSPTLKEQQSAAALLQAELFAPAQSEQGMPAPFLHTEADLSLIAALLKLVDRKKLLIDHLRMANEAMTALRQHPLAANIGLNQPTPLQTLASDASVASGNGEDGGQETDSTLLAGTMQSSSGHPAAIGSASIASSLSPQLKPQLAVGNVHAIQFTPDQFAAAWQLFQRQYAWVVLQLETTSHNLEAAMTQLRARRTASRRTTASLLTSSSSFHVKALLRGGGVADDSEGGGLDGIEWMQEEAKEILREVIREMMSMRILSKTSMFADEHGTHQIQSLLANCISLMLFIQRCADEGKSMHQLNDVLVSIQPKYKEHMPIFESICKSVATIQQVILGARTSNRKSVPSL